MSHEPFENQIFHHYRKQAKEINDAIELLVNHNYIVVDLQGNIIRKNVTENDSTN
tara:strand:+ start:843 stop:1007 length:165 start_codon:yes stop_codon:yes gene_type:complete